MRSHRILAQVDEDSEKKGRATERALDRTGNVKMHIMTRGEIGLSVLTCGIALIFLGLYTNARVLWPFGSGLGVLLLFGGLFTFLFTLRGERITAPHWLAIVLAVLAVGLHVYENAFMRTGAFSIGFLLWSLMPYGLCLVASSFSGTRIAAIAGAFVALSFDLMVHYDVFMNPREFNVASAFLLIFAPLCNTLIFCPLAIVIAWWFLRRRNHQGDDAPWPERRSNENR